MPDITGAQMRAARALVRWRAEDLADASKVGVATIRRAEGVDGALSMTQANQAAIRAALEAAGVEFIAGDGGGPGVRLALLNWWHLHLSPRGWTRGSQALGYGRASPEDKPRDAVLTIRQEVRGTGIELPPSLVWMSSDRAVVRSLLLEYPKLLDGSSAPTIEELEAKK